MVILPFHLTVMKINLKKKVKRKQRKGHMFLLLLYTPKVGKKTSKMGGCQLP